MSIRTSEVHELDSSDVFDALLLKTQRRARPFLAADAPGAGSVLGGQSPRSVLRLIEKLGKTRVPALIVGEPGTGKAVVARAIHSASRSGPFVVIDCRSIAGPLMESELFGHVKGAFAGASTAKVGLIEAANGGTAFFDGIDALSLDLQAKLLRALQEREFCPLGSTSIRRSDFRIIAATDRDLAKDVEAGSFLRDLFFRLNVINVRLAPLRERLGRKRSRGRVTASQTRKKTSQKSFTGSVCQLFTCAGGFTKSSGICIRCGLRAQGFFAISTSSGTITLRDQ